MVKIKINNGGQVSLNVSFLIVFFFSYVVHVKAISLYNASIGIKLTIHINIAPKAKYN